MKVLLFGGSGLVGSRVVDLLRHDFDLIAPSSDQVDLTMESQLLACIDQIKPSLILYAAGYTNVDLAETNKQLCFLLNVKAPQLIAQRCASDRIQFYYLSTDYVFDGTQVERPYTEEDKPNPSPSFYAQSKLQGEEVTLDASSKNCVVRLIMPFSAVYKKKTDLARLVLGKLKKGEKVLGIIDQKINPIFVDDLTMGIGKLLNAHSSGIYHLGALDFTTPNKFIKKIAEVFNLDENLVEDITFEEFSKTRPAKRPQHTWLDTTKFRKQFGEGILHTVEESVEIFKQAVDAKGDN